MSLFHLLLFPGVVGKPPIGAPSASSLVRMMPDVRRNIDRMTDCVTEGLLPEARSRAEMTLLSTTVRYAVSNDPDSVAAQAVAVWHRVLDGEVAFVEAPRAQADLVLNFTDRVRFTARDVLGLATLRRRVTDWGHGQFTFSVTGSVDVACQSPLGLRLSRDTLLQTTLHEIGHYLGLEDSSRPGELMGPIDPARPVSGPTRAEVEALTDVRRHAEAALASLTALSPSSD